MNRLLPDLSLWYVVLKVVEDLESLDLDNPNTSNEDRFKDWMSPFEDDFNLMRMK
jgi:hypothetical protein